MLNVNQDKLKKRDAPTGYPLSTIAASLHIKLVINKQESSPCEEKLREALETPREEIELVNTQRLPWLVSLSSQTAVWVSADSSLCWRRSSILNDYISIYWSEREVFEELTHKHAFPPLRYLEAFKEDKQKHALTRGFTSIPNKCSFRHFIFSHLAKPIGSSSSSSFCPTESSESPRCSTPVFAKQRRTRPFIACELCRQRAFQTPNENDTKNEKAHVHHHHHHRSTTLFYQPSQSTMKTQRRRSSIAQLLVWIV